MSLRRAAALAAAIAFSFTACKGGGTQSSPGAGTGGSDEIVVGEYSSLTGGTATFGQSTHNAIVLAFDEINAAGGINGKKLKLLTEDDQSKPEEAATAATKLINQNRVVALLGEVASSRSLAAAPIAQANKVPMISPSSTNPKVTQVGDYIFRVCFLDSFQGAVVAKFVANTLKLKRVAVLYDVRNDYSVGLRGFFSDTFKGLGGQIIGEQSYSEGDSDFRAQLTQLKSLKPEAIYVPGYYTEAGTIARQARELGITVPLLGSDGWDSPKLFEIGGKAIEGSYLSNHYSVDDPDPVIQKFLSSYKAKYGAMPDALAALAYDAAKILADALKRAGSTEGPKLRDAIAATKDFQGVTGKITIGPDRNAIKPAFLLKVGTTKFDLVETMAP
jgi:branched-chain amino acid transport system substrate-binding protein